MSIYEKYKQQAAEYRNAINNVMTELERDEEDLRNLIDEASTKIDEVENNILPKINILSERISEMRSMIQPDAGQVNPPLWVEPDGKMTIADKLKRTLGDFPADGRILYQDLVEKCILKFPDVNRTSIPTQVKNLVQEGYVRRIQQGVYVIGNRGRKAD